MKIFTVSEYERNLKISTLCSYLNKEEKIIIKKLKYYGSIFQSSLKLSKNPINFENDFVIFKGIAGTFNLFNKIQIDIVPKYLREDSTKPSDWKNDFFCLTIYSKYHLIINNNKVFWGLSKNLDFQKLIILTFIELFNTKRSPLVRKYRKYYFEDFILEGDVDEESIYFPSNNGFKQSLTALDYNNYFNYVLKKATEILFSISKDNNEKNSLLNIIHSIKIKNTIKYEVKKSISLPSRYKSLKPLFDLATDICLNYGFKESNKVKSNETFAFVVHTWKIWEDFLSYFMKKNIPYGYCETQKKFILGHRETINSRIPTEINTRPDIIWFFQSTKIIIDAKYKNIDKNGRILESDLYESLAFALSTKATFVLLMYPQNPVNKSIGSISIIEKVSISNIFILAVTVNTAGISIKNGYQNFKTNFLLELDTIINLHFIRS